MSKSEQVGIPLEVLTRKAPEMCNFSKNSTLIITGKIIASGKCLVNGVWLIPVNVCSFLSNYLADFQNSDINGNIGYFENYRAT